MHSNSLKESGGLGPLGLSLFMGIAAVAACDPETAEIDNVEERAASREVVEDVVPDDHDHDDCGFGSYQSPVEVRWVADAGDLPELEVDFAVTYGPEDRVEIQFMAAPMPASGVSVAYGEAVSVRADGRVPMPAELVAAVRSGKAYAAYALLSACDADDPHGNCVLRNANEIYIEDGKAFLPDRYQIYLREKWSAKKPWLFEGGVVTNVVDYGGQ